MRTDNKCSRACACSEGKVPNGGRGGHSDGSEDGEAKEGCRVWWYI